MQKIHSLVLVAGVLARVGAGAIVLPLNDLTTPALGASPCCDPYCVGQPTASLALSLNFTKVEYKL